MERKIEQKEKQEEDFDQYSILSKFESKTRENTQKNKSKCKCNFCLNKTVPQNDSFRDSSKSTATTTTIFLNMKIK